jgi:hypothetical protein
MRMVLAAAALAAVVVIAGAGNGSGRASVAADSAPIGRYLVQARGLRVYFENRDLTWGWNSGELVRRLATDAALRAEVDLQLDRMQRLGVNEIAFELRSVGDVDDNQPPPDCRLSSQLGAHWPDPLPGEVNGLRTLLAIADQHRMRLVLHLTNTHHEAAWALQERWLGPLLGAVKDAPALDYVTFDGDVSLLGNGNCGGQSEAALWNGHSSPTGRFVAAAIRYGIDLGISPRKLTAEAIITVPLHWEPVDTMQRIFDELGVPDAERTYALSLYEQEPDPHRRADAALARAYQIIGKRPGDSAGARVTLGEFGNQSPIPRSWSSSRAVESVGILMQRYRIEGGNYWLWAEMNTRYEAQQLAEGVKRRGRAFAYNPVAREIRDLYGFHVESIAGGSFETGWRAAWTISGKGAAGDVAFANAARLPWRGTKTLRLRGRGTIAAMSAPIRVSGGTTYTTTGDFRVQRPGSFVVFRYLTCERVPSSERPETRFPLSKSRSFEAKPFVYTTPSDACFVRIRMVSVRGELLADNLR